MAIPAAFTEFNDLGHSVMPIFLDGSFALLIFYI